MNQPRDHSAPLTPPLPAGERSSGQSAGTPAALGYRLAAEWEPHAATWLSWPHNRESWPGKFEPVPAIWTEVVRTLAEFEPVHVLAGGAAVMAEAQRLVGGLRNVTLHDVPTNDAWCRDHGPMFLSTAPSPSGRGQGEGEARTTQRQPHHAPLPADVLEFARQLRRDQTDAEKLLWSLLRERRLAGREFRRQHPVEKYVLDFYCHELQLAVELDGGQHNTPQGRQHDEARSRTLAARGIRVLRFWNDDVLRDTQCVLEAIWNAVLDRGALTPALSRREREEELPRGLAPALIDWEYNAWGGKYPPFDADNAVPQRVAAITGRRRFHPGIVLEGGAIDGNGQGTLLVTEQCLLNENRNPGLARADMERYLADFCGAKKILWLGRGIEGDDTDGHIDELARFVGPRRVLAAFEPDPADPNHEPLAENLARLNQMTDQDGQPLEVLRLLMPRTMYHDGQRLPASYLNFYIANGAVLVPQFDDPADAETLKILADCFPDRAIRGIRATDLVWGLGAFHCITQQEPKAVL